MTPRTPTILAATMLALLLPPAFADPVDDLLAEHFEVDGLEQRYVVINVLNGYDLTPGTTIPQQQTPDQDVPDHDGTPEVETDDYPGSDPVELPDHDGTPAGPSIYLGSVLVEDRDGEFCVFATVNGLAEEQQVMCYNPDSELHRDLLATIPRGATPLFAQVPATDPYDTPDDMGGTPPQDVPDVPDTPGAETPDVDPIPVGPYRVPKYELSVYYRVYHDCSHITNFVNVLGQVQLYKPFESGPEGLAWAKAHAVGLHLRVYYNLYQDGTFVSGNGYSIPLAGQFLATAWENTTQGTFCP